MNMKLFDLMKLPEYTPLFKSKRVMVLGGGAVGSYLVEFLVKMGVGTIVVVDFDRVEEGNISKHSCIIRTPEDIGRNKAQAVAQRAQVLMVPGGKAHGIDCNVTRLGPMTYAGFDAVLLALDNFAAKVLVNQQLLQLPEDIRPVVGMSGTVGEAASDVLIRPGEKLCLRCLFDEDWLENAAVRTSCAGPQYLQSIGVSGIIRTSGLASGLAAAYQAEMFRAWVLGDSNVLDTRVSYTAYPRLNLSDSEPMKKNACPDCTMIHPPKEIRHLSGSVLDLTLEDAFHQITGSLGTENYSLLPHLLLFDGVGYGGFIREEYCHHCGKAVQVYTHESRIRYEDILCEDCISRDRRTYFQADRPVCEPMHSFHPGDNDRKLRNMTLYELGFPVGAYLYAVCPELNAKVCFTCREDGARLMETENLI